jgi:hypothetical protein
VVLEDDGEVAYAYLLEGENIVSDVWLYNVLPSSITGDRPANSPPLNSGEFCEKNNLPRLSHDARIDCRWLENGVEVWIDHIRLARLEVGVKPGWSKLAKTASPLARPFDA